MPRPRDQQPGRRQPGLTGLLFLSLLTGGCQSWQQHVDKLTTWFQPEPKRFVAHNGQYFPNFIHRFFPKAKTFEQRYRHMAEAREGVRVIQVKPLNERPRPQNESNLSWSANGAYLSYEALDHRHRHIMLKSLSGPLVKKLAMVPKGSSNFLEGLVSQQIVSYNSGLSWAHNGRQYAFMSNGGTGVYNIYVGEVGADEHIVANSSQKEGYAVWNPQAPELAFVSARSGQGDMYLLNLDDENLTRLTFSPATDLFPEWLPDGRGLIYVSGPSNAHQLHLLRRSAAGDWHEPQPLTGTDQDHLRPRVSPNGHYVAYYASQPNEQHNAYQPRWGLYVLTLKRDPLAQRTTHPVLIASDVMVDLNTGPAWSPDSHTLFFVKNDPARFHPIHAYDLTSGQIEQVPTGTRMNRDILMSSLGVLSFRAQVGAWDRVFVALTNQGQQFHRATPTHRTRATADKSIKTLDNEAMDISHWVSPTSSKPSTPMSDASFTDPYQPD